jgi:hypothetical protein
MKIAKIGAISTLALGYATSALAQTDPFNPNRELPTTSFTDINGVFRLIQRLANWAFAFLLALSVMFVLYAAFLYLTAGGDQEKVTKANHIILYAAIAIVIAVLAKAVPGIVITFIGN